MTKPADPRLAGLTQIATLLSDQACADLAQATAVCHDIDLDLKALTAQAAAMRENAGDLADGAVLAYALRANHARRATLLQKLARAQARRLDLLRQAQSAEGRRQALESLNGHAS